MQTNPDGRRRRVLISAAACGPGDEPEQTAAWEFAKAAARNHDVWVVTTPRLRERIEEALAREPELAAHLRFEYFDLPRSVQMLRRRSSDIYWYYALWQYRARAVFTRMNSNIGFDVAHHVTFANDWLPCGLTALRDVPLVWGPVGGASRFPIWRFRRWLGPRGFAVELVRASLVWVPRRVWGDGTARAAAVVVAQNNEVAARFHQGRRVVVEPNAAIEQSPRPAIRPADVPPTAVFAGRLIGWKGARLAVAAIAHPAARDWRLQVFGDGYDRQYLEGLAARLGVSERVEFVGHRPRAELLEALRGADAFLFPSLHDQAGWVVAEASAAGCPVVCFPFGGPPVLAGQNARVASPEGDVVANLARALARTRESPGVPHQRWSPTRLPSLIGGWYSDAINRAR